MLCVCFAEEDSQPDTTSINVVLLGALAKDFNQAVNQGVGTPQGSYRPGETNFLFTTSTADFSVLICDHSVVFIYI